MNGKPIYTVRDYSEHKYKIDSDKLTTYKICF